MSREQKYPKPALIIAATSDVLKQKVIGEFSNIWRVKLRTKIRFEYSVPKEITTEIIEGIQLYGTKKEAEQCARIMFGTNAEGTYSVIPDSTDDFSAVPIRTLLSGLDTGKSEPDEEQETPHESFVKGFREVPPETPDTSEGCHLTSLIDDPIETLDIEDSKPDTDAPPEDTDSP